MRLRRWSWRMVKPSIMLPMIQDIEVAVPKFRRVKASKKIMSAATSVAPFGPPPVMIRMFEEVWRAAAKAPMKLIATQ